MLELEVTQRETRINSMKKKSRDRNALELHMKDLKSATSM